MTVDVEKTRLLGVAQWNCLLMQDQGFFGRIGDNRMVFLDHKNRIERLFGTDVARLIGWAGITWVHIHDPTAKSMVTVTDSLSQTE